MSVVTTDTECNMCGYEHALRETNVRTIEEHEVCPYCGYAWWTTLVRNKADGSPKQRKDGTYIRNRYFRGGIGAWAILNTLTGVAVGGSFTKEPSEEEILWFLTLEDHEPNTKLLFFSVFEEGKISVLVNENFLDESGFKAPAHPTKPPTTTIAEDKYLDVYVDFVDKLLDEN